MSDIVTNTSATPNFEKLKAKLRELFELDKADLDFGIYRILRQRHAEITEFLDKHLEKTVREALTSHGDLQNQQVKQELETAEDTARKLGIAPEQSPKVMELRIKYKAGADLNAIADEVYSHLYTFFARYYQEGDFLGLPRSTVQGREKYMIPYNGEEVKLVWANMDQYYIKSSELLRDYTFRIRRADLNIMQPTLLIASDEPEEVVIHFKLVEGDTEKDNRKPDGKTTRAFALDADQPFVESDETTLNLRFRYREQATEPNLQRKLNDLTEKTLADNLPAKWQRLLLANDPTYKGKDNRDTRTILQKHLRDYTARHQFDYFIHKDLGGFLQRELDFYIKNEVMHLDDIEGLAAPKAEEYLSKIRALRRCALPVIRMLAQLEDFQKKLWLKKKFVVETRYCLTLDRMPEELYEEICVNDAQWAEWEQLYAISEIEQNLLTAKPRTPAFLSQHPYLMLDTLHFDGEFKLRLLASIDNLDEMLDGVCFHSENFQALQLMQERYQEQVKCVYIDPPYNTGLGDFPYKDNYQHSSWISLIMDRFIATRSVIKSSGVLWVTIDDGESGNLRLVGEAIWGTDCFMGGIAWEKVYSPRMDSVVFSSSYDHLLVFSRSHDWSPNRVKVDPNLDQFPHQDQTGRRYRSDPLRKWGKGSLREDRPNLWFPIVSPSGREVWPLKPDGTEGRWRWEKATVVNRYHELDWLDKGNGLQPYVRQYADESDDRPVETLWKYTEAGSTHESQEELKALVSKAGFPTPKPTKLVAKIINSSSDTGSLILDYFAGSGTTGHAVISLNRSEEGSLRKYILVEMGEHFDPLLVPRLKKVVYSTDWRDGKPQNRDTGISHAFKIVRLESYEDTLNNLRLQRTPEQIAALQRADEHQRDQYMLGYFLDVESAGSASLLDVEQFHDPFGYQLQIATASAGETKATTIDLVETFNWLLGLQVKHIDSQRGFLTVTGEQRAGGRTLILWRTLSDDPKADNLALEKYLDRLAINPADTEFDFIYVNGSHTLPDPHNKIHLIEEVFQRRMFESEAFESLR